MGSQSTEQMFAGVTWDVSDGKAASASLGREDVGAPGNATREIFDAASRRDQTCKTP